MTPSPLVSRARMIMEAKLRHAAHAKKRQVAALIRKLHGLPPRGKLEGPGPEVDPLTSLCLEELPPTRRGYRLCLSWSAQADPPLFSRMLAKPHVCAKKLEEEYEEACEIYPAGAVRNAVIGVVFEAGGELFVFTRTGDTSEGSVLVLRWRNQVRFIYSLGGFLLAMGAEHAPSSGS